MIQATSVKRTNGDGMTAAARFLTDAATHGGVAPDRRETHISLLFLTPDRAYKLKKPVKLAFLDFSTAPKREAACRREVAVNRAFAPQLYLGLRPILAGLDGVLAFGPLMTDPDAPLVGGDAVVDWVVEMRRFDSDAEFDRLAEKKALTPALMRALADKIAASHSAAPKLAVDQRGAAPRETIDEVVSTLGGSPLEQTARLWGARAAAEAERIATVLRARRRHGFPRRLHGDLHLGNICLLDGAPTPFDAIEFDERIATVDPLYDVAFTVMDLLWRDEAALAQQFLSRYLGATRDYGGLAAWPLFLSLRAAIRAMTATLSGDADLGRRKLDFAQNLLARRPAPRLVVVGGLSGTGKSTLANALAPHLAPFGGAVSISSDATRKRLFGVSPETRLGPEGYAAGTHERVYRRMLVDARRALRAGACVVIDAVYMLRAQRDAARETAAALGAGFEGFWLETPLDTRLARVDRRSAGPKTDPSDADATIAAGQSASLAEDEAGWTRLDAGEAQEPTLRRALALLGLREQIIDKSAL